MFILIMTNLKAKAPQFIYETGNYNTIGTNDYDSLITWSIEKEIHGYEINYFFHEFESLWAINPDDNKESIGCDLSTPKGKNLDNHVNRFNYMSPRNDESVNLNNMFNVNGQNYGKKYAMSTTLMMWSLYDIPLPKDEVSKIFLITLDAGFQGHYKYNGRFRKTHHEWLEILGFTELIDILNKYDKPDKFHYLIKKMKEKGDYIRMNENGFLETGTINLDNLSKSLGIKLYLPSEQFVKIQDYDKKYGNRLTDKWIETDENVYSFALTYKDEICYSIKK